MSNPTQLNLNATLVTLSKYEFLEKAGKRQVIYINANHELALRPKGLSYLELLHRSKHPETYTVPSIIAERLTALLDKESIATYVSLTPSEKEELPKDAGRNPTVHSDRVQTIKMAKNALVIFSEHLKSNQEIHKNAIDQIETLTLGLAVPLTGYQRTPPIDVNRRNNGKDNELPAPSSYDQMMDQARSEHKSMKRLEESRLAAEKLDSRTKNREANEEFFNSLAEEIAHQKNMKPERARNALDSMLGVLLKDSWVEKAKSGRIRLSEKDEQQIQEWATSNFKLNPFVLL